MSAVGGQAVIEGVMMRAPKSMAVAVRRADGTIDLRDEPWYSVADRFPILKRPFLRGAVVLWESMHNGMSAMSWSGDRAMRDEDAANGKAPGDADEGPAKGSLAMSATVAMSVLFAFGLFIALPHLITLLGGRLLGVAALDGTSPTFHLVAGGVKVCVLLAYMWAISRLPDVHRVFQYHGAEHKAIHAFEAGGPLDVDTARAQTRLHPRCGTSFLFLVVLTSVFVFSTVFAFVDLPIENGALRQLALIALKLPLLLPIAGIAFEVQRLSARFPDAWWVRPLVAPGMGLQLITTQEPDDSQLEVALASLYAALAREADHAENGERREYTVLGLGDLQPAPLAAAE